MNEPFEYVIDRASGIVTVVYSAPVNARRWEATMDRVLADPSAERPIASSAIAAPSSARLH